jgi:general secretion pathway protein G
MKKRKGFTLIELMIVIAIIIILAAIAIPNYLRMTDRARRARVAGDFASIATSLEAYSVDWGHYPVATTAQLINKTTIDTVIEGELSGDTAGNPTENIAAHTTLTGEAGGIDYIKTGTLVSMYNPFNTTTGYNYGSATLGKHWILYCTYNSTDDLYRTDSIPDLTQVVIASLPTIP